MRSVQDLMSLEGRTALVTGGGGHIGSVVGEALAEAGAEIALLDGDPDRCQAAAERIHDRHGRRTQALTVDLMDTDALRAVPGQVISSLGRLDIVVNCAALVGTSNLEGWSSSFETQSDRTFALALAVNLTAVFVLVQAAAPALAASQHGAVVNVASIYGLVGPDWRLYEGGVSGNPAGYAASKGGLLQMTRWLATTLAPRIRVNALTPGGVFRATPEPFLSRYVSKTPLGRMAVEQDLKGAAVYLASDLSEYVTGQNLVVDGGFTAW